jgi:hypothetical protein
MMSSFRDTTFDVKTLALTLVVLLQVGTVADIETSEEALFSLHIERLLQSPPL